MKLEDVVASHKRDWTVRVRTGSEWNEGPDQLKLRGLGAVKGDVLKMMVAGQEVVLLVAKSREEADGTVMLGGLVLGCENTELEEVMKESRGFHCCPKD